MENIHFITQSNTLYNLFSPHVADMQVSDLFTYRSTIFQLCQDGCDKTGPQQCRYILDDLVMDIQRNRPLIIRPEMTSIKN